MTGYAEDGGYFSPSLQDEVFQQVTTVPDSVLLHATQLDSIQVNTLIDTWTVCRFANARDIMLRAAKAPMQVQFYAENILFSFRITSDSINVS